MAQGEPPGRVGRLAFTDGTVSFHDDEQSGWTPAVVNTPPTIDDGLWTEPNARSEISLAGTRIRLEGAAQLDMLALDDTRTRLQLAQGRIDVKSFVMDARQPHEIVPPRGTIAPQAAPATRPEPSRPQPQAAPPRAPQQERLPHHVEQPRQQAVPAPQQTRPAPPPSQAAPQQPKPPEQAQSRPPQPDNRKDDKK